ncbi:hypothetical protein DL93DRAFT_1318671 [Clavulina sp. PMI_390]|nr:hypothetical protein DL93DRAFT_1318671 [Clavulina sp. PMI_390]
MTTVYSDELPLYPVADDDLRAYLPQWRSPLQRYFPLNKLRSTKQLAQMVDLMARQIFPDAAKYKIDEYRSSPTSAAPNAIVLYRKTVDVEGGRRAWNPCMIFPLAVGDISNPCTRSAAHHKAVKTQVSWSMALVGAFGFLRVLAFSLYQIEPCRPRKKYP